MTDTMQAETPMSDHVARFWRHLETETVRVLVDLKRTIGHDAPDGPSVYWDGASFYDAVAKALVAERAKLRAALKPFTMQIELIECTSDHTYSDDTTWPLEDCFALKLGDLRRARAVFEQTDTGTKTGT